jgi:putative transposase
VHFGETLSLSGLRPSIGSVGDAYDTQSTMGLWMADREPDPSYDWRFELTA